MGVFTDYIIDFIVYPNLFDLLHIRTAHFDFRTSSPQSVHQVGANHYRFFCFHARFDEYLHARHSQRHETAVTKPPRPPDSRGALAATDHPM